MSLQSFHALWFSCSSCPWGCQLPPRQLLHTYISCVPLCIPLPLALEAKSQFGFLLSAVSVIRKLLSLLVSPIHFTSPTIFLPLNRMIRNASLCTSQGSCEDRIYENPSTRIKFDAKIINFVLFHFICTTSAAHSKKLSLTCSCSLPGCRRVQACLANW